MKKLLLCLLLGVGCHIAIAQQTAAIDSATMVVDRFLKILNYEAIRNDSILYVESTITTRNDTGDTLWMRRWFLWPNLNRTELWHEGVLKFGLVSNGHGRYRRFDPDKRIWKDAQEFSYVDQAMAYDYRGPLYRWNMNGLELIYQGEWNYNSNKVYRILIKDPSRYDRYYMFEKESGLLFLIKELETQGDDVMTSDIHVDWRAYHEYMPFGRSILPSVESYQKGPSITIIHHSYSYLPVDTTIFNRDKR